MPSNFKKKLPNIILGLGILMIVVSFGPFLLGELKYSIMQSQGSLYQLVGDDSGGSDQSPFGFLKKQAIISLKPVNTDFAIVIEKIGVNAPIVHNVPVWNKDSYMEALKKGVAHASFSDYPDEISSNVYLFAHSSLNIFEHGKYATVFNLLRKVEKYDRIHIFYDNKIYIYEVVTKEIVRGWDTHPLKRHTIEPLLTIQTCDPPGTTLNRLVVTSRLVKVEEL